MSMSYAEVPGTLGAGGRHGRRLPGVGDASARSGRRRSPRGASHRPCTPYPVSPSIRTLPSSPQLHSHSSARSSHIGGAVPQTELPVAGGVAVPVGERLHPALQPRPLHDVGGERRGRHGGGCATAVRGCRCLVLPSIAVLTVDGGEAVMQKTRKPIG
jgi:hypothetical protein